MSKYRPKKDSDQWRETILEARKSGLSDQEYCRTHGIPSSTF
ncbi:IS66 family insertion sequence element accessory protein TnpA [Oribacterium sp. HCP28S3_H8]